LSNFVKNDEDPTLLLCKTHYVARFHKGEGNTGAIKASGKVSTSTSSFATTRISTKCKLCGNSVYPNDPQINLDGNIIHNSCAKCADCKCQITLANFVKNESTDEGVSTLLLCRTHYNARQDGGERVGTEKFKGKTGGVIAERASAFANLKISPKCKICTKSVYANDPQINLDGNIIHNACAKCNDCKCQITLKNFVKNDLPGSTLLLCTVHYYKRYHEGAGLLGADKFKRQPGDVDLDGVPISPSTISSEPVPPTPPTDEENSEPSSESPNDETPEGEVSPNEENPEGEEAPQEETPEGEEAPKEVTPEGEETPKEVTPEDEETPKEETPEGEETPKEETPKVEETPKEETPEGEETPKEETPESEEAPKGESSEV